MRADVVPFFPLNKPNSSKGYPSPSGKMLLDNWISLFSYPHNMSLTVRGTNGSCLSSSSIDPNATRMIFSDSGRCTTEARALWKKNPLSTLSKVLVWYLGRIWNKVWLLYYNCCLHWKKCKSWWVQLLFIFWFRFFFKVDNNYCITNQLHAMAESLVQFTVKELKV